MDNKFEVTEEIYEYFKDKNVTSNLIKKCIPNYMDYASSETVLCDNIYRSDISNELNTLLNDERKIFKPQDLCAKIYDIFCNTDKTVEMQDFSIVLDYDGFDVWTVKEKEIKETDSEVLDRIRKEINDFKTKRKNQIKVAQDLDKQLLEIAGNETLMQELLKLREQIKNEK